MSKYPKFIIENDSLILSTVNLHRDIVVTDDKNVKGGGWWRFNSETQTFTFWDSSIDFGKAKLADIVSCIANDKVYSSKMEIDSIANKFNFAYENDDNTITKIDKQLIENSLKTQNQKTKEQTKKTFWKRFFNINL